MRFAIFSDVHANLEALEAVLADARERNCTHFVCLGDVVGYNANPHECVERVRELDCPIVKGNHDEQATLVESSSDFNPVAERAIQWTRDHLAEEDRQWLQDLPLQKQVRDFTIVHATLDTPSKWGYVFNNLDAAASFAYQHTGVCFFGHTHVPMVFIRDDGDIKRERMEYVRIKPNTKYFINTVASANRATETGARAIAFTTLKRTSSSSCASNTTWRRRKKKSLKLVCRDCSPSGLPLEDKVASTLPWPPKP